MTRKELKKELMTIRKELETATGCDRIRLTEELETVLYLIGKKG